MGSDFFLCANGAAAVGFLSTFFEKRSALRLDSPADARVLLQMIGGDSSTTTPGNAMEIAAAWACVQVLAKGISMLPLVLIEQQGTQKRRATNHPLFPLLHRRPNPDMTSSTLRSTMMVHLATRGNAYVQKVYSRGGQLIQLWPLHPDRMEGIEREENGDLQYQYRMPNGTLRRFASAEIMHVRGMSEDGIIGLSPIAVARRTFDRKKRLEQYEAAFWNNGARPGVVLKSTAAPNDKQAAQLLASWDERFMGAMNTGKTALLPSHLSLETIGLPQSDAQFLESQKFSRTEIASIFGVPSHMINDLDRATFSNIAEQGQEFVDYTLGFWLQQIEQTIEQSLLPERERGRFYPKFIVQALLRGNPTERAAAFSTGLQWGYYCINDIREMEDLNPIADGDTYFVPMNMQPLGQAINGPPAAGDGQRSVDHDEDCTCGHCGHHANPAPVSRETRADAADQQADKLRVSRQKLARAQLPVFEDTARRIVRREARDVRQAAKKMLGKRTVADFTAWLREFYAEEAEFCEAVRDAFLPLLTAYATQAATQAADELDQDDNGLTDEMRQFVDDYARSLTNQHAARSRNQLEGVLVDAQADGQDELEAVSARLDQWEEERPERIAMKHAFEALNAFVVFSYRDHGVRYLRWMASGASCPFCLGLSGKIAGIDSYFVEGGATLDGGDAGSMTVASSRRYGPLHRSCDCVVVAA